MTKEKENIEQPAFRWCKLFLVLMKEIQDQWCCCCSDHRKSQLWIEEREHRYGDDQHWNFIPVTEVLVDNEVEGDEENRKRSENLSQPAT